MNIQANNQVHATLKNLVAAQKDEARPGDPKLHNFLDKLNEEQGVFDDVVEVYEAGAAPHRREYDGDPYGDHDGHDHGRGHLGDHLEAKQEGIGISIASLAMADGEMDFDELDAIEAMIGDQVTDERVPRLLSYDVQVFANLPNDDVRAWALENQNTEIGLEEAKTLADMIYPNHQEDRFSHYSFPFGSKITDEAKLFFDAASDPDSVFGLERDPFGGKGGRRYVGTEVDKARLMDRHESGETGDKTGPRETAVRAGVEYAIDRAKGFKDSEAARAFFERKEKKAYDRLDKMNARQ